MGIRFCVFPKGEGGRGVISCRYVVVMIEYLNPS